MTHKTYGNVFTCKSNESITIPKGEYKIIAKAGEDTKYNRSHTVFDQTTFYYTYSLFKNALLYYSDTITINDNSNIVLKMSYNCSCIIGEKEEGNCYSYLIRYKAFDGKKHELNLYKDKYYIVFYNKAYSCETDVYFSIEVDENPYTISVYNIRADLMQHGKYYVLHTTQVESTNNSFDMQYISMVEGEI